MENEDANTNAQEIKKLWEQTNYKKWSNLNATNC